jgi:hypothetical protein
VAIDSLWCEQVAHNCYMLAAHSYLRGFFLFANDQIVIHRAAHQLRQDKNQDMRQKKQRQTSASWLRPVCDGFHNIIRFNCAPLFALCRRHRVLTVTCLDACRCATYHRESGNLVQTVTVLTFVQDVTLSNFGRNTDSCSSWFSVPLGVLWDSA